VTEKRNRWFINVVLVLAVLAMIGFSLFPLLSSVNPGSNAPIATSPTPTQTVSPTAKKEELEAQVKGYELVLQREPENLTALNGLLEARLGLISMGFGQVKDVIPPLEKLVKLNPDDTRYAVLLAQAKQQTGDREGAAQVFRTVLETKPGDVNALDGMVSLLLQQGRPEAAIGLLQDTLKKAPQANQIQAGTINVASVQLLLGRVYAEQKRYAEAIAVYEEAAKINPNDFRPVLAKAIVLQDQGKNDEAKLLFTKAGELAPPQFKDQINKLASSTLTPAPSASPTASPSAGASPTPSASPAPTTSP